MARDDWYRNEQWSDAIAQEFEARLARARKDSRPQYIYIQAVTLAETAPTVALALVDRYFETGDTFFVSDALAAQATALRALGDKDGAIQTWERTLAHEKANPHLTSNAARDYVRFIATDKRKDLYIRATEVTAESEEAFAIDAFLSLSIAALSAQASGKTALAKTRAAAALEVAGIEDSGYSYHPGIGLVDERYTTIVHHMQRITNPSILDRLLRRS